MGINENFKVIRTLFIILIVWNIILTGMILVGNIVEISQNHQLSKITIHNNNVHHPSEVPTITPTFEEIEDDYDRQIAVEQWVESHLD